MREVDEYNKAKKELENVSRGGKDYHACSFMDISVRIDRLKDAKKKLIISLGKKEFKKMFDDKDLLN